MHRPRLASFLVALAAAAAYVSLDWLSYIRPLHQSSITPWNPHPAVAIALVAFRGQRTLPVVFAAAVAAEALVRGASTGWGPTLLAAAVLSLGYAAMATALTARVALRSGLTARSEMAHLIAVVTLGSLVTGTLYVGAAWGSGAPLPGPYLVALLQFWIGDCVGILVSLPLILIAANPERRAELLALARKPVAWIQCASVVLVLWLVFGPAFSQPFKFFYLLFLPLVWISVQHGLPGAVLATLGIQMGIIAAMQVGEYPTLNAFELQALLIALAVTGLVLGVVVDERRRAAEGLRESLRLAAAGEMSAALAHELNQPLTALVTYARAAQLIAASPAFDAAQLRSTLDKLLSQANRSAEVVRRLRDFFRTGSTVLRPSSLDGVAALVLAAMQPRAEALGVTLERRISQDTPQVLADALQIEVVLKNLVANALEAAASAGMAAARWVRIEIGPGEPGYVRAVVRDSGNGVSPLDRDRVFEPFWSSRASGMGMGLAISRAIVEAHGGRLWVETAGEGLFGFTLPTADA